jgi:hypothetical protein
VWALCWQIDCRALRVIPRKVVKRQCAGFVSFQHAPMCESGISPIAAMRGPGNLYRPNRSVKKQKAGAQTPALQAHRAGAPSEVDPGIAPVSTSGSVPHRRRSGNALPACIGVDITRSDGAQNGLPVTLASLSVPVSQERATGKTAVRSRQAVYSTCLGTVHIAGG